MSSEAFDSVKPPDAPDASLERALHASLDGLLPALELQPLGDDRYGVGGEPARFERIFGGQTVAQALLAACATVPGKDPRSLHAYFVDGGAPDEALELAVERVRDGRSASTRRVTALQGNRQILIMVASFHTNRGAAELSDPAPVTPRPEQLPVLQDWARDLPADLRMFTRGWVDHPPPLELRIGEPPSFLGGPAGREARSHWMRLPRDVGDDPALHTALLVYASDYLLLDMAFRAHPERVGPTSITGSSLDHNVWLHRPVRFDRWHLHTQRTLALSGDRGLVRGEIHDEDGHLVASVMQEVLARPAR